MSFCSLPSLPDAVGLIAHHCHADESLSFLLVAGTWFLKDDTFFGYYVTLCREILDLIFYWLSSYLHGHQRWQKTT